MTPGVRRLGFVLGVAGIVLVVLPAVHEFGHVLAAVLVGAEVGDVTWTLLGGHAPSTQLLSASPESLPWIAAGGLVLPTALGLALLGLWALCCTHPRSPVWLLALLGGVCLTGGTFGCVSEAFSPPTSYAHLRGLAERFGLSGGTAIVFQSVPAVLVALVYLLVFVRIRRLRSAAAAAWQGSVRVAGLTAVLAVAGSASAAPSKYMEDFEFLRKTVEERYAGLKPKKIDWAAECARAKPTFAACTDDVEHVKNVMRLLAVLRDSHTGVTDTTVDGKQLPSKWGAGSYGAGLWIGWDKGRLVVQGMMPGLTLEGVVPLGSTIAAVDGEPAWIAMERLKRRILEFEGTSTDASLWASMDNKLVPFGEAQKADLLVLTPEGKSKTVAAPRWGPGGKAFYHECTWPEGVAYAEGAVAKMLETPWCRKLGYLRITGGMNEPTVAAFHAAFDSLKGMEACLLDCRWMGGGGDQHAWAMAGRFFKVGADNGEYGKLGPTGPWQFDGPVVMLQNENEVSSAETFTWAMTETRRCVSVGRPTGGWGIIPDSFSCPSGLVTFRLGVNMRATPITHVQTEGVGWPPDVLVPFGPVVRARPDPVREIGMDLLHAMKAGLKTDRARELFGGLFAGKIAEFKKGIAEAKGYDGGPIAALAEEDLRKRLAAEIALLSLDDAGPPDVLGARARLAEIEPLATAAGMKSPLGSLQAAVKKLAAEGDAQAEFLALVGRDLDALPKAREKFLAARKGTQIAKFAKERLWK